MTQACTVGLIASSGAPVPLAGVRLDVTLNGPVADVALTHRYVNAEATPIEAVYLFPLPAEAALRGVSARVGDRVIEGRVEERSAAFQTYDDALADGHGAVLVDQERADIFRLSVGNLRPGDAVEVCMRYAQLVRLEGSALRLQIPTVVAPRYVPASTQVGVVGETDQELLNPERRTSVPYGLTLAVDAHLPRGVRSVESPSHPIRVEHSAEGARVSLSRADVPLDRDVVLLLEPAAPNEPFASVAVDSKGRRHVLVAFQPDEASVTAAAPVGVEVLFLLDCSGSMEGSSIDQARRALALCIRTLRAGDRFDIVRFGSSYQALWGAARDFDEASLREASAWLEARGADLGGTEILPALQSLLSRPLAPSHTRQVVLLTDGQVSNEADVIALAGHHAAQARVFAFGIGDGVGEALVRGVARASRGESELIGSGERIEPKVLRQFGRLRQPALGNVSVDFGEAVVTQAPTALPPVFAGDRLVVYGRIESGHTGSAQLRAGDRSWTVPVDLERPIKSEAVGALWARARLAELEDRGAGRRGSVQARAEGRGDGPQRVLALALEYQLASSATSWVLVETRSPADRSTAPAALRNVPLTQRMPAYATGSDRPAYQRALSPSGGAPTKTFAGGMIPPPPPSPVAFAPMAPPASAAPAGAVSRAMSAARSALGGARDLLRKRSAPPSVADEAGAELSFSVQGVAEITASGGDDLYDVLMAQRADGAFEASAAVQRALGGAYAALMADGGGAARVTQAVLHWLETQHGGRRDEWRGAADKASQFLASATPTAAPRVAQWFGAP